MSRELKVYFDYNFVKGDSYFLSGYVGYASEKSMRCLVNNVKMTETNNSENNYHRTLKSMLECLIDLLDKEELLKEFDEVILLNQNGLVFDWLASGEYPASYAEIFNEIYTVIVENDDKIRLGYDVIKGKDNRAKNFIKQKMMSGNFKTKTKKTLNTSLIKERMYSERDLIKEDLEEQLDITENSEVELGNVANGNIIPFTRVRF